ncbi:SDR family oxidoreductase [Scrofimicrobium sp. R131]|uniref:SDR family oxidoreductase n=1 Tax=Scrofimicrobium appendicitidis TaxID=3079930 RepID=A0AAU7V531_9ACTO
MTNQNRMDGKVVVLTGGGGGIARGVARAFAREGAKLVLTDISPVGMERTQQELESAFGTEVLSLVVDGAQEDQVQVAVEQVRSHFGRLDVLINSAQTSASGLLLVEHTKEDFDLAIYSGLYSTFFFLKHAFPLLKESAGSVINFASGAGISGNPGQSSYAAAKEGIRGLSRVAAHEWGVYNINVNVVAPLVMTDRLADWGRENPEMFEKNIQAIPLGRYGDAEKDIGGVCLFLASEDAKYVTGDTIQIQGGLGMRP